MIRAGARGEEHVEGGRLSELYVRYSSSAVRLAYLLTGDRELADDLVQDAFVKLASRFVDLRQPESFEAYLRRTIVNLSRSHFRRRKLERRYLDLQTRMRRTQQDDLDLDTRDAMKSALLQLPERQRTAIVLRFYEDLSELQTAEILRCRPGTVKSLVSRGLERLRQQIRGESDGD